MGSAYTTQILRLGFDEGFLYMKEDGLFGGTSVTFCTVSSLCPFLLVVNVCDLNLHPCWVSKLWCVSGTQVTPFSLGRYPYDRTSKCICNGKPFVDSLVTRSVLDIYDFTLLLTLFPLNISEFHRWCPIRKFLFHH